MKVQMLYMLLILRGRKFGLEDIEEKNEGIEVELTPLFDDTTTKQAMTMQSPETAPGCSC